MVICRPALLALALSGGVTDVFFAVVAAGAGAGVSVYTSAETVFQVPTNFFSFGWMVAHDIKAAIARILRTE